MAIPRLRLSESQARDLLQVCELGPGRLQDLTAILNNPNDSPIISRALLRSRMSQAIPDDEIEPTTRLLFGLAIIARDNFVSSSEFLTALDRAVAELNWESARQKFWQDAREPLIQALYARDLVLSAKAMDLIFDFEKYCLNSRIITDIRPVYNNDHSKIIGGIIMHTLRIEYRAEDGDRRSISIELDSRDIERLADACMEANKKMATAKAMFSRELKRPTITATEGLE